MLKCLAGESTLTRPFSRRPCDPSVPQASSLSVPPQTSPMKLVPLELAEANAFVAEWHRHHKPVVGHRFSLGASVAEKIVAVAIVGRPVARMNQDGSTVEIVRLASDGTKNACSFLYGRARKAAFALGYSRIITYTLPEEGGASLRGAGFKLLGVRGGGSWSRDSRPRVDKHPLQEKFAWESVA